MAIRYKVVTYDRRSCFVGNACSSYYRFTINYKKGHIVQKKEGTCGIFVFKRRCDAERLIRTTNQLINCKILRVRGIGKGITLKSRPQSFSYKSIELFSLAFDDIKDALNKGKPLRDNFLEEECDIAFTNDGTMVYDAVEVLN